MKTLYAKERPVISATKLVKVGGEKGAPGCPRKLAGEYLWGVKQAKTAALERGSALHAIGEVYQNTGEVINPESDEAEIFQAGRHLLEVGTMAVEWEHGGELPCGTPFVAYLDARDHCELSDGRFRIRDLKTCSRAQSALTESTEDDKSMWLRNHHQAMFYAYLLLCVKHMTAPPLPSDKHFGPKHWEVWDPQERIPSGQVRLEWIYFRTKNRATAWPVADVVTAEEAQEYYDTHLAPLVREINLIFYWREQNPDASIDELSVFEKNGLSCKGQAIWCGPGEHGLCDFGAPGEPVEQLVQLRKRPKQMTPQERLAKRKAERAARLNGGAAPAAEQKIETKQAPVEEPAEVEETQEEAAPKAAKKKRVAKKARGRAKAPTTQPVDENGDESGVNPPESKDKLANLPAADELVAPAPKDVTPVTLKTVSVEALLAELFARVAKAVK